MASLINGLFTCLIPTPPSKVCGSKGGPPITAKRVLLKDGRFLAYYESGVNKNDARCSIIFCHAFFGSRLDTFRTSPEVVEELGVHMVGFDRAGYGESDPNPNRTVRSSALDVEELADALGIGAKFYIVGVSIGCHVAWGAIKYIPERLAGVVLLGPIVNYRWPGFPQKHVGDLYKKQLLGDQLVTFISYYVPSILHWWMEQTWLPSSSIVHGTTYHPNKSDAEKLKRRIADGTFRKVVENATRQGKYESIYREIKVMHGKWEFNPMNLKEPPFPVNIYQGDEDGIVQVELQRYIADKLNWVNYHELPSTGHFLNTMKGVGDEVLQTLLVNHSRNEVSVKF